MSDALRIRTTVTTDIELGIDTAAQWFCGLDDDQMARFFVAVAGMAPQLFGSEYKAECQWWFVGGHLRRCECSTEAGREMLRRIVASMESDVHDHGEEHVSGT
jgi:hypothetical protein